MSTTNTITLKMALEGVNQVELGIAQIDAKVAAVGNRFLDIRRPIRDAIGSFEAFARIGNAAGIPQLNGVASAANAASFAVSGLKDTFEALQAFSVVKLGAGGLIFAALGAIGVAFGGYKKAVDAATVATGRLADVNDRLAGSIEKVVAARLHAGELSKEQADEARMFLQRASELRGTDPETSRQLLLGLAENVRKESKPSFTQDAADARRALGLARAEASVEVERARIAKENELAQQQLDEQLIQLDGYLARRRQLAVESHKTETGLIERQEFDAKARMLTADEAGKLRLLADIEGLHAKRKTLDTKLEQDLSSIAAEGHRQRKTLADRAALEVERRNRDAIQKMSQELASLVAAQESARFNLGLERAKSEGSFSLTAAERRQQLIASLQQEQDIIRQQLEALRERKALLLPSDTGNAGFLDAQIAGLQRRDSELSGQRSGLGADPNSFFDQFTTRITALRDQFGTVAQSVAATFTNTIGTAIDSITNGLTDAIMGAKSLGEAMRQVGRTILTEIVSSIIRMGVQWVMTHILMRGAMILTSAIGSGLKKKETGETLAQEAIKAPALATNAASASIGSYGAAAVVGAILAVAALGTVLAFAMGGFREGGYTGSGPSNQVAGAVHRGEFVFSAPAVDRIGLGNLEALHSGSPLQAASTGESNVNVVFVNDQAHLREFLKSNEGRAVIIDMVSRNKRQMGIG